MDPTRGAVTPNQSVPPPFAGLTILLVEDHAETRDAIQGLLEHAGARVLVAEDGDQGLRILEAAAPHVILCDLTMPRMDGFAFIKRVRGTPRHTHRPVIAVSGRNTGADLKKALEAGFDAHLPKPVDWEAVVSAVTVFAPCPRGSRSGRAA